METKDFIFIVLAILGWLWGIFQFIVSRRNQKRDKLIDRKYEAYSAYMKKVDEVMNNVRKSPDYILGLFSDFMKVCISEDSEEIDNALIKFNEHILDYIKTATEPLLIVKQELNALLIICSNDLREKINELIALTTDYNNEMQECLSRMLPTDSDSMIQELHNFTHNERWMRFQKLNDEILEKMRDEIDNK